MPSSVFTSGTVFSALLFIFPYDKIAVVITMNLNFLSSAILNIDEISVIGKEFIADGTVYNAVGLVRRGTTASLILISYDEKYRELCEEAEIEELTPTKKKRITYRTELKNNKKFEKKNICDNIIKIIIGDREFTVTSSTETRLDDTSELVFIAEFIKKGWTPLSLGDYNTEDLYIEAVEFNEEVESLSSLDTSSIELVRGNSESTFFAEKKVKLSVGEQNKKVSVKNKETGEAYTVYINEVSFFDPWEHIENMFNNPEFLKRIPEDEIPEFRKNAEESTESLCPKGMRLPVVEYECEELSVQFYLKDYLDSEPDYSGCGPTAIFVAGDKKVGSHGINMRSCVIQSPVPSETDEISAELFSCIKTVPANNIKI